MANVAGVGSSHWNAISVTDKAQAHIGHNYITNLRISQQSAREVIRACRKSTHAFAPFVDEVQSFRILLEATEDAIDGQKLESKHTTQFTTVIDGCNSCLSDLKQFIDHYNELPTATQRSWERMQNVVDELDELKGRLGRCIGSLGVLNSVFATRLFVQQGVNKFIDEVRTGKREGSIVSSHSRISVISMQSKISAGFSSLNDGADWKVLCMELEDIGITPAMFTEHKELISKIFLAAFESGQLEEQPPPPILHQISEVLPTGDFQSVSSMALLDFEERESPLPELSTQHGQTLPNPDLPKILSHPARISTPKNAIIRKTPAVFTAVASLFSSSSNMRHLSNFLDAINEKDFASVNALFAKSGATDRVWDSTMRGDTILETATKVGHGEIFMLLFCHAINTRKKLEPTMLHTAADNCHSLIIQIILGKRKDWVNEVDHKDRTALFIAARYGDLETAQVLIACGANLEILCNGCTALQIASAFGHVGFAKLLLDSGAGIEDSGPGRNTPLIEASTHGNLAMVMLLIAWGADLNARSRKRGTALAYATYHQQHEVVKYLRQVGATEFGSGYENYILSGQRRTHGQTWEGQL